MAAVRLVPLAPFPAVGLVAGAIRMKPRINRSVPFSAICPAYSWRPSCDQLAAALEDSANINWWRTRALIPVLVVGTAARR